MLLKRPAHTVKISAWQGGWFILCDDIRETVWTKIKGGKKHVIRRCWEEDITEDYTSWEVWISDDIDNSGWGIISNNVPNFIKEYY